MDLSSKITETLNNNFDAVRCQGEGLYRAAKLHKGSEFQIHYFDISKSIMAEDFDVESYQKKIMLGDYYSVSGSLQWNYYLHFILDKDELMLLKRNDLLKGIVANKRLARKSVDTFESLLVAFNRDVKQVQGHVVNVVDEWRNVLGDDIPDIFNEDIPVTKVLTGFMEVEPSRIMRIGFRPEPTVAMNQTFPVVQKLTLDQFRIFPERREFSFGMVNLIRGPNASGKTSLLEAIELSVCGRSLRDPKEEHDFKFTVLTGDGKRETFERLNNKEYRQRDRDWYGATYKTGNTLYKSFSRYNYFDADAAVRFSRETEESGNIVEALSKVVFGPESGSILKRIERLKDLINERSRGIEGVLNNHKSLCGELESELDRIQRTVFDEISTSFLFDRIKQLGLNVSEGADDPLEDCITRVTSLGHEMVRWSTGIQAFAVNTREDLEPAFSKLKSTIERLDTLQGKQRVNSDNLKSVTANIEKLDELQRVLKRLLRYRDSKAYHLSTLQESSIQLADEIRRLAAADSAFAKVDRNILQTLHGESVAHARKRMILQVDGIHARKADISAKLEAVKVQMERSSAVIQEIRAKGVVYADLHPETESCPLCLSDLAPNKLNDRLAQFIEDSDSTSTELSEVIYKLEDTNNELAESQKILSSIELIDQARVALGFPEGGFIREVLASLEKAATKRSSLKIERDDIDARIEGYVESGYSAQEYQSLRNSTLLSSYEPVKSEGLGALVDETQLALDEKRALMAKHEAVFGDEVKEIDYLRAQFPVLKTYQFTGGGKILQQFMSMKEAMLSIGQVLHVNADDPYSIVASRVSEIKSLIRNYEEFKNVQARELEIEEKLSTLKDEIERERPNQKKLLELFEKLVVIIRDKRPDVYISDFMESHSARISQIFNRIHSPKEFNKVVLDGNELYAIRVVGDEPATISQLSTGQRTALVLSVFLSMHLSNINGPKILIFDDPVAYVDDLNVLLFLDYLRVMAEEKDTQIFFATANEKIAFHFQKKFDYLSDDMGFKDIHVGRAQL
jgi:DNA repair exonuclease SbcCD ATPase subunit